MHWATLAADAELGITDELSCSICGHPEVGLLYFPQDMSARQATWISRLWCDPEQVRICEACVDGHGGVTGIRGLDADNWLERRIAVFQARENGKRCESEDSAGVRRSDWDFLGRRKCLYAVKTQKTRSRRMCYQGPFGGSK